MFHASGLSITYKIDIGSKEALIGKRESNQVRNNAQRKGERGEKTVTANRKETVKMKCGY
jgi:hypothetical protein